MTEHDERCCMNGGPGWSPHPECPGIGALTIAPVVPFGAATCLNCGRQFFLDTDPNGMFCDDNCAGQYTSELGL